MARKDVHAFVSGMGGACSIVETLVREARDCGVPDETIHNLTTEDGRKIIQGWVQELKKVAKAKAVVINLSDLILVAHFDWWNGDILKWRREDKVPTALGEVELLHLGCDISTKDVLAAIDKQGLCPANAEELCNYAAKNPDEQRKYPIVALGSVFVGPADGGRCSPVLCESAPRRGLYLRWRGIDWDACCQFAVVRKGDWES